MNETLRQLKDYYAKILNDINVSNNIDEESPIKLTTNERKIRDGIYSLSFMIPAPENDNDSKPRKKPIEVTLYITIRRNTASVMFTNDRTHEIIFNHIGMDAVTKSEKYVRNYLEKNIQKFYGLTSNDKSPEVSVRG